jgi:hypothetical protein
LQIAHGVLFGVVAARIGVESGATGGGHADEVRAFVQQRMNGGVEPRVDPRADQTRLAFAPVRTGDDFVGRDQGERQTISLQQEFEIQPLDGIDLQHGGRGAT